MRDQLTRLRPFLTVASVVVLCAWAASPAMATNPCLSDNPPPRCFPDPEPRPPEPALPVPTDLGATSVRATSVQLQWTDVSQGEDDNVVSYAGHEIHVGPQPPNTRVNVNVTGLSPAERYTFTVQVAKQGHDTGVSVPVSVSTPGLRIVTLNTVCGKYDGAFQVVPVGGVPFARLADYSAAPTSRS